VPRLAAAAAGRILARSCGTEVQAVALVDGWINGFVQKRARATALQLNLGFIPGLCLLFRLELGLGFSLDLCGVFAAGLPFGLLGRDALRSLVRPREQLVKPRCPVVSGGFIFRARLWIWPGSGLRIQIRYAL
jgi:hypothetical protein